MKKILIVSPFGIGDVLFSTPLIAALKESEADVSISYVGNARTVPFLKHDLRLDKVFSYERDEFVAVYKRSPWQFFLKWKAFADDVRREKFDIAFDLSTGSPVGVVLMLAGIPVRIGFDYKGRGRWLTHKVPFKGYEGRHVAEYILELMGFCDVIGRPEAGSLPFAVGRVPRERKGAAGQDPMTEHVMKLFVPQEDSSWALKFMAEHDLKEKAFIIICPGGGASWGKSAEFKRWPAGQYAHLVEKIIERSKCPIILLGDKSETDLCDIIADGQKGRVMVLAGRTSLLQSAGLMKQSSFVIVNDGGPLHVAVAAGARTVSVFGPVDPRVYGPYASGGHKIVTKHLACQPCYRNFRMPHCTHHSCLKNLTVDEVFRALEEWL